MLLYCFVNELLIRKEISGPPVIKTVFLLKRQKYLNLLEIKKGVQYESYGWQKYYLRGSGWQIWVVVQLSLKDSMCNL
jgi:hypothetical protein